MSSQSKFITVAVVLAIIVAIPILLLQRRPKVPEDKVTRVAMASMVSDLRGLVLAEQATRLRKGRYLVDPEAAGHLSSPGVTVPVITLSDTGWSAIVRHKTVPDIQCAVAVYNRNPLKRFAKSGEIVCE
jgi:hypothetical protein